MHFSLQEKPRDVIHNKWVIISLILLLVIGCIAAYILAGVGYVYAVLLITITMAIAVSIKLTGRKAFPEFDITEQGIVVDDKLYAWPQMKYYSWYGEKQSERIGIVSVTRILDYDPINPYKYAKTQILELNLGVGKNLRVQIDSSRKDELASILAQYGIKHISILRKIVGY